MRHPVSTNALIVLCAASAALTVTVAELFWSADPVEADAAAAGRTAVAPAGVHPPARLFDSLPLGCTSGWSGTESEAWLNVTRETRGPSSIPEQPQAAEEPEWHEGEESPQVVRHGPVKRPQPRSKAQKHSPAQLQTSDLQQAATLYLPHSVRTGSTAAPGEITLFHHGPDDEIVFESPLITKTGALPVSHTRPQRLPAVIPQTAAHRVPSSQDEAPSAHDALLSPQDMLLAPQGALLSGGGDDEDLLLSSPDADPLDALESLVPGRTSKRGAMNGPAADHVADPLDSLSGDTPNEQVPAPAPETANAASVDPHAELFLEDCYPSAQTCAKCHPKHYDEWRVSAHAYASISPMFQRFEQAMQDLTRGTVGAFCVRCHAPVATQLERPAYASILDAPPVIREGITCIACHRINEAYGRTHGDRRIEPGDIHAPVRGSSDGSGIRDALARASELKLKTSANQSGPGQSMHGYGGFFAPLSRSDFCAPCHQVAVHPGIGLEIVHAQFRAGPAHAKGITCQDCHMGAVPGKAEGYEYDYCAVINDKPFGEPRKHANHMFWGPNYSIAHPGLFPHNKDADRYSPRQWLAFEYRSGWGTPEFERAVPADMTFPEPWDTVDDRIDGRKVIDANMKHMSTKRGAAVLTLSAGIRVQGPNFHPERPTTLRPLRFSYRIDNISQGHNVPTGSLGAQPQMWLNVALVDPDGVRVWESGYLDSGGDLADLMSVDVAEHRVPRDAQLFNLQTKFLVNNIRGTDREAPVPLNFSLDQLVFLRPGAVPVSVLNHPPLIRMEAHSIEPLGHRIARYCVPAEAITKPGQYRLSARMRSRPEPPYFMRLVGASPEMIRRLNENIVDFETSSETFTVLPQ